MTAAPGTTLLHTLNNPGTLLQAGAAQGYSVAIDGAVTVVGAPNEDAGATDTGLVRVYDSATGVLLHTLLNPNPQTAGSFGVSVAVSGNRVVVGAYKDNSGAFNTGIAHVYDLTSATPASPILTLKNPAPNPSDHFGFAVAISGEHVLIGALHDGAGAPAAGRAYLYDLGSAAPTVPAMTFDNPAPAELDQFGVSVAINGNRLVVGAYGDDTGANDAGAAYVYDLGSATPTIPIVTLNNPAPGNDDRFGISVSLSGARVAVGVYGANDVHFDSGLVYVYDLDSGAPTVPVVTLHNPTPGTSDQYGYAVAIRGDGVLVGAPFDDSVVTDGGNVYLYDLGGSTPAVPIKTLAKLDPGTTAQFGWSVALDGVRAVVGAQRDDQGATDGGSASIYDLAGVSPVPPLATLRTATPIAGDLFGVAVGISGTRMVVGVPNDDTGAADSGSAHIYDLSGRLPTVPTLTLCNPTPQAGDMFGNSAAIGGNWVVIGAPYGDAGVPDAGSVYVYDLGSATPTVSAMTLLNPDPMAGDMFGFSVGISGNRVVVGAFKDDSGATNAGSVYIYDLSSVTPTLPMLTLTNPAPAALDQFGVSVAIDGDRVVVGMFGGDVGATDAGSAYVYDLASATPLVPLQLLTNPTPAVSDQFGYAVAISGNRVVIGTRYDDTDGNDSGSAYVYDLGSATPSVPTMTLRHPFARATDRFGNSVAIDGDRVMVGAEGDDTGNADSGVAFLFNLNSGSPQVPVARFANPAPGGNDFFGYTVALEGAYALVGQPYDDYGGQDRGAVHVFTYTEESDRPVGGSFSLNSLSLVKAGIETATFVGWTDATLPLTYSVMEGGTALGSAVGNPTPTFTLTHGTHWVYGRVADGLGRFTETAPVEISADGIAPTLTIPTNFATAATSAAGAVVTFPVSAVDDRDPAPSVVVNPPSGSTFPIGSTTVVVTAQDDLGNVVIRRFVVRVWDPSKPETSLQPDMLWWTADASVPGGQSDMQQGYSVAVSGGLAVVGAPLDNLGATDAGSVRVYATATGTLLHLLPNPHPVGGDKFGWSVAVSGALVVVGVYGDDTGATDAGSAYVFDLNSITPTVPVLTLRNPTPAPSDQFGIAVAISGTRVIVGAPFDDTGARDAGSAYVYDLANGTPTTPVAVLNNPTPGISDQFGISVGISGLRAVVGSALDDVGASNVGSVYVYDFASASPSLPTVTLNNPSPAANDQFGNAVALDGARLVVGAHFDDAGAINAGSVYVFDLAGATPATPVTTLTNPAPASSDEFGHAVAISGTRVVVGALRDDALASNSGSAYVYDLNSGTPTVALLTLENPTPEAGDNFGHAVAINGATVVVGALLNDGASVDSGAAYIFGPFPGSTPVAVADTVMRTAGRSLKIPFAALLANDLAALSPPLAVTAVDTVSAGGVPLLVIGDAVFYSPAADFNATDTFTYTVSDGTHPVTATVTVQVQGLSEKVTLNIVGSVLDAGAMQVTAAGIPGRSYQLQVAGSLVSPAWTDVGTAAVAPVDGRLLFSDPAPASPAFYRVIEAAP